MRTRPFVFLVDYRRAGVTAHDTSAFPALTICAYYARNVCILARKGNYRPQRMSIWAASWVCFTILYQDSSVAIMQKLYTLTHRSKIRPKTYPVIGAGTAFIIVEPPHMLDTKLPYVGTELNNALIDTEGTVEVTFYRSTQCAYFIWRQDFWIRILAELWYALRFLRRHCDCLRQNNFKANLLIWIM